MNPSRVDSIVDLTYGLLIAISVALIVIVNQPVGLAFGFGVLISYIIHVVWKMARFDPDWMTTAVKETVEETVDDLQETVDDLEDKVSDEDVLERVEDLESDIDDLQTWQDQIKETFGG